MIRRKRPTRANLKPRKPIPRVNVKRKAANHERAYGEKAAWIRGFPYRFVESCHRELHRVGITTFEARHEVNLKARAAEFEARWLAHTGDAT